MDTCPRGGGLSIRVEFGHDLRRPGLQLTGRWVAAVVQVHATQAFGEHDAHAVEASGRRHSVRESAPGPGVIALRVPARRRVHGHFRGLAVAGRQLPADPRASGLQGVGEVAPGVRF